LGALAVGGASNAVAVGEGANASFTESIALGAGSATTKTNQFVVGDDAQEIVEVVIGEGVTNAAPMAQLLFTTTNGSGVSVHATDLVLQSGLSTGAGAATDIVFKTPDVGLVSDATLQTAVTRLTISDTDALFGVTQRLTEGTSTATPASATVAVYAKADGLVYSKDDAGAETLMSGGGGGGGGAADDADSILAGQVFS
jgi:hypothetical protein